MDSDRNETSGKGFLLSLRNAVSKLLLGAKPDPDPEPTPPEQNSDDDDGGHDPNDRAGAIYYDVYYDNYIVLYNLYGRGRPKLTRSQFRALDQELLDLVGGQPGSRGGADGSQLSPERTAAQFDRQTFNRIREVEYLLMDDISEALLETKEMKKVVKQMADESKDTTEGRQAGFKLEARWSEDLGSHLP